MNAEIIRLADYKKSNESSEIQVESGAQNAQILMPHKLIRFFNLEPQDVKRLIVEYGWLSPTVAHVLINRLRLRCE